MHKIRNLIRHRLLRELQIPDYILQEFLRESVRKNNFSLRFICAIIFVVELFNIARVLLWTQTGLSTRNNRIYFAMYCALILIAVSWLVLRRLLRQAAVGRQLAAQHVVTSLIFLWHMALNTYDLYRDSTAGTAVMTTALLGLALLIQSPPCYSAAQLTVGYLLFWFIMAPLLDAGEQINLTITFVVSLAVSLVHAHHISVMLKQHKQIVEINRKLQELVHQDPLTRLLNKTTMECRTEQVLQELDHAGKSGGLTLFLVDLDEFKRINDHYGHPCGDCVLTEAAEAIRRIFPDATGLGRIGGDEFAILYNHPLSQPRVMTLWQQFGEQLGKIRWQNQPLEIQCSAGVCICIQPQCTYQQLYADTDRMLYQAKRTGKGRCCVQLLGHAEKQLFEKEPV